MRLLRQIQCNVLSHRVVRKNGMEIKEKNMQCISRRKKKKYSTLNE